MRSFLLIPCLPCLEVITLNHSVDFETYVKLSEEEEQQLRNEMSEMQTKEKEQVLELIISYEKKVLEKGLKEGLQ